MSPEGWPMGWGMDGGLGVGLGSFFVGFRGRVRVGDTIWGVIYNRGEVLFTFYLLFTLPATPATPRETWVFRVVPSAWVHLCAQARLNFNYISDRSLTGSNSCNHHTSSALPEP